MEQLGLPVDPPSESSPVTLAGVPAAIPARPCECGCGVSLTGRQVRFASRLCSSRWWDGQHPRVNLLPAPGRDGSIRDAVAALLADGRWRTAHEIAEAVRAFPHSVSARLAELRKQGLPIESDAEVGNTRRAHRFRLAQR